MASEAPSPSGGYRNNPTYAPQPSSTVPSAPTGGDGLSGLSGIFACDLEKLRRARNAFIGVADDAHILTRRLDAAVDDPALGAHPWGEDPLGQTFESQFADLAKQTRQAVDALDGIFQRIADDLDRAGRGFTATDQDNAQLVMSIGSGW